jgi:phosphoglycerate dehydrogenase-like enzyme
MTYRIGFTGSHTPEWVKQAMVEAMKDKGYRLDLLTMKTRNAFEWKEDLEPYDVIISSGEKYARETIEHLSGRLKMISRCGIGFDEIDLAAATDLGVAVTNCGGTMAGGVAETAMLLMLNLLRRFHEADANVRAGKWNNGFVGHQLEGLTVGLVGFGAISRKLAQYLQGFSCKLLAYDKLFNNQAAAALGVRQCSLEELAQSADFVSLHVPANAETKGMCDRRFFAMMKPTAYLINTARGAVVNEMDLIEALQNKTIAGAGLDVFEREPVDPGNPLLKMENVFLTPHIASSTVESILEASLRACGNAMAFLEGRELPNLLNPGFIDHI